MNDRTTQILLLAVSILLAHLLHTASVATSVHAAEVGTAPSVLRATVIELVDEGGQVRANLKVEPDGEVVFRMIDAKGTIRVKMGAAEDGSGLVLFDDRTEPAVHILAKRTGTTLTLAEKGRETRVFKP